MTMSKTKVDGTKLEHEFSSEAEANEWAAALEMQAKRKEMGWLERFLNDTVDYGDRAFEAGGRSFPAITSVILALVLSLYAFSAWSRLLPLQGAYLGSVMGIIGVAMVWIVKVAAGRIGIAQIKAKRAEMTGHPDDEYQHQANRWLILAVVLVLLETVVAFSFATAINADSQTGRMETNRTIEELKREARQIEQDAIRMERPSLPLDVLEFDLQQTLDASAINNAGQPAGISVREVIGWGTDSYCMPGGQYASYIDRHCPDVSDLHRQVMLRRAYDAQLEAAQTKRETAATLQEGRPDMASGASLGNFMTDFQAKILLALVMLTLMGIMATLAWMAKRHPKGID